MLKHCYPALFITIRTQVRGWLSLADTCTIHVLHVDSHQKLMAACSRPGLVKAGKAITMTASSPLKVAHLSITTRTRNKCLSMFPNKNTTAITTTRVTFVAASSKCHDSESTSSEI
ncbi:hypothetical protein BDR04DRAFT_1112037, partial [Suillus decipiens]